MEACYADNYECVEILIKYSKITTNNNEYKYLLAYNMKDFNEQTCATLTFDKRILDLLYN